jgi:acetylglutamate kinase
MKTKLKAAAEAVNQGVGKVIIASALGETPLQSALAGAGTVVSP